MQLPTSSGCPCRTIGRYWQRELTQVRVEGACSVVASNRKQLAKTNTLGLETPGISQTKFSQRGARTKSTSLINQQVAGDQVPGWHKIEDLDDSDGENQSQHHETGEDDNYNTQQSRLTSQAAAQTPEQQYFNFLEQIGKEPRFTEEELADL